MVAATVRRVGRLWHRLAENLAFRPGLLAVLFTAAGIVLVEVDQGIDLTGQEWAFQGDGDAARTVLSVLAGSLITVAGLTFSITIVVLQLASSQFSPRILRTFFGDRLTQLTIGTYVGTFIFAILVLRAVGSTADGGFVPRLSVTVASVLGIAAVILLLVFLHHVSRMIQVSHVASSLAHETLKRTDKLFPEPYCKPEEGERQPGELLRAWRSEPGGSIATHRPGFVQGVGLEDLVRQLGGRADRVALLVAPGDFVSAEQSLAEVWPASDAAACERPIRRSITIAGERDLDQDVGFGVRQLADIALKALSPAINDPATAVTCIGYLRSILVRLVGRAEPPGVRHLGDRGGTIIVPQRRFEDQLEALRQIGRSAAGDAWVVEELLLALSACAEAAGACGANDRLRAIRKTAVAIGSEATGETGEAQDGRRIEQIMDRFGGEMPRS